MTITIVTTAENTASETTPRPLPMLANISPTSPLGTIPIPIESLSTPRMAYPQMTFPRIAAIVKASASNNASACRNDWRLTCKPIRTKKTGAKSFSRGPMISATVCFSSPSCLKSSSFSNRPAANAPTIEAKPITLETQAMRKASIRGYNNLIDRRSNLPVFEMIQ